MNKSSVENFYRNMNLSDLLQVVCKDIKSFLSDKNPELLNDKLTEHFIAANELLNRVDVRHSYHSENGDNILTTSGQGLNSVNIAARELEDMLLPDGKVVAILTLGEYHAARQKPEINWF